MAEQPKGLKVDRRHLLRGAAVAGASAVAAPLSAKAQTQTAAAQPARNGSAPQPNTAFETELPPEKPPMYQKDCGSDFMCDVIKNLKIKHVAANPSASFRGLHESLINYLKIDYHTCTHEEQSVAFCHGYAKTANEPMLMLAHGTVGLQHATMAIYNCWADRAPAICFAGNWAAVDSRGNLVDWWHSAQDPGALVRDFVKWDDRPASLQHFAESLTRAYKIAMTPPYGPVLLVVDAALQEGPRAPYNQFDKLTIPPFPEIAPTIGDLGAVNETAKLLINAENPVIVAGHAAHSEAGIAKLVDLAETLQCAVVDQGSRMNFPNRHPLAQRDRGRGLIGQADVILALEVADLWGLTHRIHDGIDVYSERVGNPNVKIISIDPSAGFLHSNYQDFERYANADISMAASSEDTIPYLTEAIKTMLTTEKKSAFADRGKKLAAARQQSLEAARNAALFGWDQSPIGTGRLCAELWEAIRNYDWAQAGCNNGFVSGWPSKLWEYTKPWHNIGGAGAAGLGYGPPAAAGAGLANKLAGRFTVDIQSDGDFNYNPGALWICAHSQLPVLYVMHNNKAYHQELMTVQRIANRRQRGIDNVHIGCTLDDPTINYAEIAKGYGLASFGPVTDPGDLRGVFKRAVDVVRSGEPAVVDVHTQPR